MTDTEILRKQVREYVEHADNKSLRIVQAILEIEQEEDWWDELPEEVQHMLDAAIKQGEEGKGISHEQMIEKYSKWFKK
jgi:hypothetical protein